MVSPFTRLCEVSEPFGSTPLHRTGVYQSPRQAAPAHSPCDRAHGSDRARAKGALAERMAGEWQWPQTAERRRSTTATRLAASTLADQPLQDPARRLLGHPVPAVGLEIR